MDPLVNALLRRWLRMLRLPRQSPPSWYRQRLLEELRERRTADTLWRKLSETSDVFFSSVRARHDGFLIRKVPSVIGIRHLPAYSYMLAKFTLRRKFYSAAAFLCKASRHNLVREVVNPYKDQNLKQVASRHQIDPVTFTRVGRQLRRIWPLLP